MCSASPTSTSPPLGGLENGTYKLITSGSAHRHARSDPANLTGTVGTGTGTLQITGNDIELVVTGIGGGPGPRGSLRDLRDRLAADRRHPDHRHHHHRAGRLQRTPSPASPAPSPSAAPAASPAPRPASPLGVLTGVSVTPTVAGSNLTFTVDDGCEPNRFDHHHHHPDSVCRLGRRRGLRRRCQRRRREKRPGLPARRGQSDRRLSHCPSSPRAPATWC